MSGGTKTKLVVLGIGDAVTETELNSTASPPVRNNVIRVRDFSSLMTVREQLRDTSCTGKWRSSLSAVYETLREKRTMCIEWYHLHLPHYESPTALLDMHHITCGISSLLYSFNLILFTLLTLRILPHHSHHLRSHIYHSFSLSLQT